jgi:hypothetical protein
VTFYTPSLSARRRPARADVEGDAEESAEAEEHDADPDEVDAAQDRYEATLGWKRGEA